MDEEEFVVKVSPIKFTVEKDGIEYEFDPIGEVTDLVKLKNDIVEIMKRFKISIKAKHIVVISRKPSTITGKFEEDYLKAKDIIKEWYKEDPEREWSANELMNTANFQKGRRSSIMNKLIRQNYIRCVNPLGSRNERRYVKAQALIVPEYGERDMKKLEEERKLVRDG